MRPRCRLAQAVLTIAVLIEIADWVVTLVIGGQAEPSPQRHQADLVGLERFLENF